MASGEGGGTWQEVQGGKNKKRAASGEGRENVPDKQRRTASPEELVVLFRVKGAKPGDAGFKAINPLQVESPLKGQIG